MRERFPENFLKKVNAPGIVLLKIPKGQFPCQGCFFVPCILPPAGTSFDGNPGNNLTIFRHFSAGGTLASFFPFKPFSFQSP
jgi:hypothetical protein